MVREAIDPVFSLFIKPPGILMDRKLSHCSDCNPFSSSNNHSHSAVSEFWTSWLWCYNSKQLPWGFSSGLVCKESACSVGDTGLIPALGRAPGEGMATHSSGLVWRIPWTEKPAGLQSIRSKWVRLTELLLTSWVQYGHKHLHLSGERYWPSSSCHQRNYVLFLLFRKGRDPSTNFTSSPFKIVSFSVLFWMSQY